MTYHVLLETLNPTHSLTPRLSRRIRCSNSNSVKQLRIKQFNPWRFPLDGVLRINALVSLFKICQPWVFLPDLCTTFWAIKNTSRKTNML